MWNFYDKIISELPNDIYVDNIIVGETWTIVHADKYCGVAVTVNETNETPCSYDYLCGLSLRDVGALCKSWNFIEASIGTAAINSYINSPDTTSRLNCLPTANAFTDYKRSAAGKKVAIIGHFTNLERFLTDSKVYVLERRPQPGDYPDSACEYLLPEMDCTFITGSAFINKTLPRLIQLSKHPVVLGPSTPLSSHILEYGAKELSGLVPDFWGKKEAEAISYGNIRLGDYGTRVRIIR